jgi:hypothetical protein
MSVESIVKAAMTTVPKAVAAGVVDIDSGMLLSIKTVESHPQKVLEMLAPATRELFEGEMVTTIENLFKKARGVESKDRYFQEMLIASTHLWHYFGRLRSNSRVVFTVVTGVDANIGLLLIKAREITANESI